MPWEVLGVERARRGLGGSELPCVPLKSRGSCLALMFASGTAGEHQQGAQSGAQGSHSAPLSPFWCFDSNPAAEGQGAGHVRCAGQHVVPGLLRAGHEGSRLSIRHPDRYRGSLGKVGLATGVEPK